MPASDQQRAQSFVASGHGLDVCTNCGIIATRHGACTACQTPYPEPRWAAAPATGETYWVRVVVGFRCPGCEARSPLNNLDFDGSVRCLQCDTDQPFESGRWNLVVNEAHAAGDLRGPSADFRVPGETYSEIGRAFAGTGIDLGDVSVNASPGHPLCGACRVPLRISYRSLPTIELGCPLCQRPPRRFDLPAEAVSRFSGLRGVYCDYHEVGRQDARIVDDQGGRQLICPGCGAPLRFPEGQTVTDCAHCHTQCRVGLRALRGVSGVRVEAQPWWLLFKGASAVRRAHSGR